MNRADRFPDTVRLHTDVYRVRRDGNRPHLNQLIRFLPPDLAARLRRGTEAGDGDLLVGGATSDQG